MMKVVIAAILGLVVLSAVPSLKEQNERLFEQLKLVRALTSDQIASLRKIFEGSKILGQGNPDVTRHSVSVEACKAKLSEQSIRYENPRFEKICGAKYMAPLYDPATQKPEDAKACIDQFEFPNIPCAYPVVWVKAREAAQICEAVGERLVDAHEWEGACQGRLQPPDYRFDLAQGLSPSAGLSRMRYAHNLAVAKEKVWSYGPAYKQGICATSGQKSPGCNGGSWTGCGSNTFPAGDFPACHSALDVYDLNGNAAEHMNLPLNASQLSSRGSKELGYTEMKGSWFIFDAYRAHEDWCRWRAPFWHGSRVMDTDSHSNYHLGFRCAKTLN